MQTKDRNAYAPVSLIYIRAELQRYLPFKVKRETLSAENSLLLQIGWWRLWLANTYLQNNQNLRIWECQKSSRLWMMYRKKISMSRWMLQNLHEKKYCMRILPFSPKPLSTCNKTLSKWYCSKKVLVNNSLGNLLSTLSNHATLPSKTIYKSLRKNNHCPNPQGARL